MIRSTAAGRSAAWRPAPAALPTAKTRIVRTTGRAKSDTLVVGERAPAGTTLLAPLIAKAAMLPSSLALTRSTAATSGTLTESARKASTMAGPIEFQSCFLIDDLHGGELRRTQSARGRAASASTPC